MLGEIERNTSGSLERRQLLFGGALRHLQPALDFSHRIEVLVDPGTVAAPHRPPQGGDVPGHDVENAPIRPYLRLPLGRRAPFAEETLEDHRRGEDDATLGDVLAIHADQITTYGGVGGIRDPGQLDAALFRPQTG